MRGREQLLIFLRDEGVLAEPSAVVAPMDQLIADYQRRLVAERGLLQATIVSYEKLARRFLRERCASIDDLCKRSRTGQSRDLAQSALSSINAPPTPCAGGGSHVEILEFGAAAVFEAEAEGGDREAHDLVVVVACGGDPSAAQIQNHQ